MEVGTTVQVVKPNEFHVDVAATTTTGTATITMEDGTTQESDYEAEGTRFAIGMLKEAAQKEQDKVALLLGLDLVILGNAQEEAGTETTMLSVGMNGALGVRFGAGDSPVFLDILGQFGFSQTMFESTNDASDTTGTLLHLGIGGSVRPGVWLGPARNVGIYGLFGIEAGQDSGTITNNPKDPMMSSTDMEYELSATTTYIGMGIAGRF
jgi:hypothetical protein